MKRPEKKLYLPFWFSIFFAFRIAELIWGEQRQDILTLAGKHWNIMQFFFFSIFQIQLFRAISESFPLIETLEWN